MSTPFPELSRLPRRARWPGRLVELGLIWRSSEKRDERDGVVSEIWTLLNSVLLRYTRQHARPYEGLTDEDLFEMAAAKALDLFRKLEQGSWDPGAASEAQTCAFLSTLARRGIVDHLRSRGRRTLVPLGAAAAAEEAEPRAAEDSPHLAAEREEFTRALCACVARLTPRARQVWLLRACLEMSSREIARHPGVRTTVPAVDVMLARARILLRRCLRAKGYEPRDMPQGTFVALWEAFSRGNSDEVGGDAISGDR